MFAATCVVVILGDSLSHTVDLKMKHEIVSSTVFEGTGRYCANVGSPLSGVPETTVTSFYPLFIYSTLKTIC